MLRTLRSQSLLVVSMFFCMALPAHASGINWGGWYTGLELGQSDFKPSWKTTKAYNPDGSSPVSTTGQVANSSVSLKSTGTIGALLGGYNWVVAPKWVVGLEGQIVLSDQSKKINYIPGLDPTPDTNPNDGMYSTVKVSVNNGANLRARAGYLVQKGTLIYASIGIAYQQMRVKVVCPADTYVCNPSDGTQSSNHSFDLTGWTAGAGIEHAFTQHLLGRIEYSYSEFPSHNFVALQWANGRSYGADARVNPSSQMLALGLLYKF